MPFLRHAELLRKEIPDHDVYPFSIPAMAHMARVEFHPQVTFLVGENGSGKSTLLEALAIHTGFNPEGGNKNFTSSHRKSESNLSDYLRVARGAKRERGGFFLRAETMFNVSTEAENYRQGDYAWENLHEKSHGEAFLWVMVNKFPPNSLYLLDEPEAALSPQRQLACLLRMQALLEQGCQFVIATHSPILMAYPGAKIIEFDSSGMHEVSYKETKHYQITRAFLNKPSRLLPELFDPS